MKIDRDTIYTKIGPAIMAGIAVCLVALTLATVVANGWPTTPPSIQTVVLLGHNLAVCIAGLVLARGKLQLVFEFWMDVGLAPMLLLVSLDWQVLPIWLCAIFVGAIAMFWVMGIRKLRMAQRADAA